MTSSRWKITIKYLGVLLLFIPMVFIKSIGMGSSDIAAVWVTLVALLGSLLALNHMHLCRTEKYVWLLLLTLGLIIMLTTGKYIVFLSIYSLFAINKLNLQKLIKVISIVCFVAFLIVILTNWNNFSYETRLINGEWTGIIKRSNGIYVSFFMLFNLFLLNNKKKHVFEYVIYAIVGVATYMYTTSRTGIVCFLFEFFLLFLFSRKGFQKSKIVKFFVCYSPIIIFAVIVGVTVFYSYIPGIDYVNLLLQHRLVQCSKIVSLYPITLLGQHVTISTVIETYLVMDNTYINLLVNYGLILSLLWILINIKTLKYLYKTSNYYGLVVVMAYSLYGITESFVIVSFLNASFLLYSEYLTNKFQDRKPICA